MSFSHGIALFSSSIFSINDGSGPLDTFLFVVFLFFLCCGGHIFPVDNDYSLIVIAVLVAVDLKIISIAPSNNFSSVNFFVFDSDIFKRIK